MDARWDFSYVNRAAAGLLGAAPAEMRGKNLWEAFPALVGTPLEGACRRAMQEQVFVEGEFHDPRTNRWLECRVQPSAPSLTLFFTDVTPLRHAETRASHHAESEALNELLQANAKEVLALNEALILSGMRQRELTGIADLLNARLKRAMQESHHRIKNNLQVVAALVELQMSEAGASDRGERLRRISRHIHVLASIHDLLTQQAREEDTGFDSLSARAGLERLLSLLQETSGVRRIRSDIADLWLPTQQVASLALIVSECVSNAIKHASGDIGVRLYQEGSRARLEVSDGGNGFPPDFDSSRASKTGLFLIDGIAEYDLRGEVQYMPLAEGGGRVTVTFPLPSDIRQSTSGSNLERRRSESN